MADKNPLQILADSVKNLAEGVGRLVERVSSLESDNSSTKQRLDRLEKEKPNESKASE